jgi:teichuronic acid exporter
MIKKLRESDFIRSVATLASGTILAQLLTYALTPIITRLYTDDEMSYQSVFTRLILFISIIATARYELAFMLPKREEHAYSLYRVSMRVLWIVFGITCIGTSVFWFQPLKDQTMNFVLLLVPLGVLASSLTNQGMNWAVRLKDFKGISFSKITQSLSNSTLSIALSPLGVFGVIGAYIVSLFAGITFFWKDFNRAKLKMKTYQLKGRDFVIAKHYADFPRINLPHALIDVTKELFIAFYMVYAFEKGVLGLYDLSFRMLKLPISIIGSSIGQVFLKKAVDTKNDGLPIFPLLRKTMLSLLLISIVPFTALIFYGEELFGFVFGENWSRAGYFAQIMGPWLMVNFLISPVSQVPLILNQQRGFFVLGILSTVLMVVTLTIGEWLPSWNLSFEQILKIVSATQFVFLTFVIFWLLRLAKKNDAHA